MKYFLFFFFLFSHISLATTHETKFFEKGLASTERLNHFLSTHPCELGLDLSCSRPFTAKDLRLLKEYFLGLEEWRRIAFDGINPMGELRFDREAEVSIGGHFKIERSKKMKITLGLDDMSQEFISEVKISTANMVFLFDSFFRLAETISKAKKLRAILERDLPFEAPVLETTYQLALNEDLWNRTRYSVLFLEKVKTLGLSFPETESTLVFASYMGKSSVYETMRTRDLDFRVKKVFFLTGQIGGGKFFDHVYKLTGFLSKVFGNTAGLFQFRDGKLKKFADDPKVMDELKSKLKPLSILLEKTPFRLTDQFIPGHFGHVAIWLGTHAELSRFEVKWQNKTISLLEHPLVKPHLELIKDGRLVVEALRLPGVTLNKLESFMDIDDLVILDPPEMAEAEVVSHILRAFEQVGKPYDFNFDVESEVEIVCSELVYAVFTNEVWPVSRSMGRFTISPDHVASKALDLMRPRVMYLDGKKIDGNLTRELERVLGLSSFSDHLP